MKVNNVNRSFFSFKSFLIGALAFLISFGFTFSTVTGTETVESDDERIESALQDTLTYENDTFIFDREQAIENGLTEEEANTLQEITLENPDTDQVGTMALPVLAVPAAVKAVAKAAAAGGAAVIAGQFMLDVYQTSVSSACRNFYGQNGIIDNFCVDNDYVNPN